MSDTAGTVENHCQDCCCARSWEALGVTTYTGMSIVEHIEQLVTQRDTLATRARELALELEEYRSIAEKIGAEKAVSQLAAMRELNELQIQRNAELSEQVSEMHRQLATMTAERDRLKEALWDVLRAFDPQHPGALPQEEFNASDGDGYFLQDVAREHARDALRGEPGGGG